MINGTGLYESVPDDLYDRIHGLYSMDIALGVLLTLCGAIGGIGNSVSIIYFLPRRDKSVHDLLYLLISIVDCLSTTWAFPMAVSLFLMRSQGLFRDKIFCTLWGVGFVFLIRMSIFLVVVISVTRTIVIIKPHHVAKRKAIIISIAAYTIWLLLIDTAFISLHFLSIKYVFMWASCTYNYPIDYTWRTSFWFCILQLELMAPPIMVFLTFAITLFSLGNRRLRNDDEKFRRASITVTLFSSIFLLCNIPCFLYQLLQLSYLLGVRGYIHHLFWDESAIYNYVSRQWFQLFPVIINSTVNPCLYILRMQNLRTWLHNRVGVL